MTRFQQKKIESLEEYVLSLHPIGYWPLVTNATDLSYGRNHGTLSGGPDYNTRGVAGQDHSALNLDGTDDYVSTTLSPFTAGGTITVAGVARRDTSTSNDVLFGSSANVALRINTGGNTVGFWSNTSTGGHTWSGAWPGNGENVSWAVIFDDTANTVELFIDGESKGVLAEADAYSSPGTFRIGAYGTNDYFDGSISHVSVWDEALTANTLRELAVAQRMIYWPFDSSSRNSAHLALAGSGLSAPAGVEAVFEYNGLELNDRAMLEKYRITDFEGIGDADIRESREPRPDADGEDFYNAKYGGKTLSISGKIEALTLLKMRDMLSDLRYAFKDITQEYPLYIKQKEHREQFNIVQAPQNYRVASGTGTISTDSSGLKVSSTGNKIITYGYRNWSSKSNQQTLNFTYGPNIGDTTTYFGIVLKMTDTANYIDAIWNSTTLKIRKVVAGVATDLATTAIAPNANANYWLKAVVQNENLSASLYHYDPDSGADSIASVSHELYGNDYYAFDEAGTPGFTINPFSNTTWAINEWRYKPLDRMTEVFIYAKKSSSLLEREGQANDRFIREFQIPLRASNPFWQSVDYRQTELEIPEQPLFTNSEFELARATAVSGIGGAGASYTLSIANWWETYNGGSGLAPTMMRVYIPQGDPMNREYMVYRGKHVGYAIVYNSEGTAKSKYVLSNDTYNTAVVTPGSQVYIRAKVTIGYPGLTSVDLGYYNNTSGGTTWTQTGLTGVGGGLSVTPGETFIGNARYEAKWLEGMLTVPVGVTEIGLGLRMNSVQPSKWGSFAVDGFQAWNTTNNQTIVGYPTELINKGNEHAKPKIILTGPIDSPVQIIDSSGNSAKTSVPIPDGEILTLDSWRRKATLIDGSDGYEYLDFNHDWLEVKPISEGVETWTVVEADIGTGGNIEAIVRDTFV